MFLDCFGASILSFLSKFFLFLASLAINSPRFYGFCKWLLLKIIKNDENSWHEKITAIEVLSERRDPIAVIAIKRIIESGNNIVDPERRSKRRTLINDMIRYLGKVGDKGSIKHFLISKNLQLNTHPKTQTGVHWSMNSSRGVLCL